MSEFSEYDGAMALAWVQANLPRLHSLIPGDIMARNVLEKVEWCGVSGDVHPLCVAVMLCKRSGAWTEPTTEAVTAILAEVNP